jgi:hypothetical protein
MFLQIKSLVKPIETKTWQESGKDFSKMKKGS